MSAVPAIRPHYRPSNRPANRPVARQLDVPRVRPRVVERPRTNLGVVFCVQVVVFGFLAGATYFASALGGQVMVEKARREVLSSNERTRASLAALVPLKAAANRAKDGLAIQKWASNNQFRAPEWAAVPSSGVKNLVASKETN